MSILGFKARVNEGGEEFVNELLPEGVYQCLIEKAELGEGTKYMSAVVEAKLLFYVRPIGDFKNKLLFFGTTTSFFNGKSKSAKAGLKASKLYNLIKTVYAFYKKDVDVSLLEPDEITDEVINFLEGKQILAVVKIGETGKNKITDVMGIKGEITAPEKVSKAGPASEADAEIDALLDS